LVWWPCIPILCTNMTNMSKLDDKVRVWWSCISIQCIKHKQTYWKCDFEWRVWCSHIPYLESNKINIFKCDDNVKREQDHINYPLIER